MTKIKQLNMTGETEEKFERWRYEWTEVIDIHMPEIDAFLFDAEEVVDRFRIWKSKRELKQQCEEKLEFCEKQMDKILNRIKRTCRERREEPD